MLASVEAQPLPLVTRCLAGAVGIDTNGDHLALGETDRLGNLVRIRGIRLNLCGKSDQEAKAIFPHACKEIARACVESAKQLGIERVDFRKRGLELEPVDPVLRARSLFSFCYARAISVLTAAFFALESR
ncbi:hypothetical protein [Candidatus Methylacidithermus pantelleriae]|uniref:Uncharacterized protein n=1 Tax=Candidatus Methylacidithermus pantelleriae TaxID=2744239 RepID=A0A8J2BNB0_9BACT|nr:hypothetical protein [Candidatus Methylacidithermus pantelleriae]CAF0695788.1 hypothetical protein MPNT_20012 [Candidatus Methylacidithermus pantelleriae]